MAWINVSSNVQSSPRLWSFQYALKVQEAHALGIMVGVWLWVANHTEDGNLSTDDVAAISERCEWPDAAQLRDALIESEFAVKLDDSRIHIPDWDDPFGKYVQFRGINGGRLPRDEWETLRTQVFQRDGYRCRYCGMVTRSPDCDHVIPIVRGGSNRMDNLATACARCNRSKGAKPLDGWMRQ